VFPLIENSEYNDDISMQQNNYWVAFCDVSTRNIAILAKMPLLAFAAK
jgi:hypothetical protein